MTNKVFKKIMKRIARDDRRKGEVECPVCKNIIDYVKISDVIVVICRTTDCVGFSKNYKKSELWKKN